MFKKLFFFIFLNIFTLSISSADIEIKARTAILQDFLSGEVLYEKNELKESEIEDVKV